MNILEISKILSNKTRLNILEWLREPGKHFPPHVDVEGFDDGVCVGYIHDKSGLSQSTISTYLTAMQKENLIIPTRYGKWTYYKRNEEVIEKYKEGISKL